MALGREEGEDHAAADEEAVGRAEEVADDAELVGHLRAAEDDGIRPLGVLGEAAQDVDLGRHEVARGVRQQPGDVVDGGLLAVHDPEAVGDEDVCERGELAGELGALVVGLGGLAGVEAEVLEEQHLAVLERRGLGLGVVADGVLGEDDVGAEHLAEALRDRREGVLGLGGALGAAEVGADDDAGAGVGQALDRRGRGADAAVVGDGRAVERHVEVGPDEDALAAQVPEVAGGLHAGCLFVSWECQPGTGWTRVRPPPRVLAEEHRGRWPGGSEGRADERDEVDEAVGVAPLVVVPADDLDLVADDLGEAGVEDARRGVGLDVLGDDRVLGVDEEALERALGGGLDRGVDLFDGRLAAGLEGQVGGRAGRAPGRGARSRRACP